MTLPTDRGHLSVEQRHQDSHDFDKRSIRECIDIMVADHSRVHQAVGDAGDEIARFVDALSCKMVNGGRLIYLGAGTSGRLGVLDASECPPTFHSEPGQVVGIIAGGDAALRRSAEGREDEWDGAASELEQLHLTSLDTVLGIAAGGTTPYVLGGLARAKRLGSMTGLITCVSVSVTDVDHVIHLQTGPELLTGSTRLKAGSATKLALNIITTTTFSRLGKVYSNLMVDLRVTNDKLLDRALRIFQELCPDLTRQRAADLLHIADGKLKTAIVMHHLQVDMATATACLDQHSGSLRACLEAHRHDPLI